MGDVGYDKRNAECFNCKYTSLIDAKILVPPGCPRTGAEIQAGLSSGKVGEKVAMEILQQISSLRDINVAREMLKGWSEEKEQGSDGPRTLWRNNATRQTQYKKPLGVKPRPLEVSDPEVALAPRGNEVAVSFSLEGVAFSELSARLVQDIQAAVQAALVKAAGVSDVPVRVSLRTDLEPPTMDPGIGEVTCTTCGLVMQSQLIDFGQEWRNFAQEGIGFGAEINTRERGDVGFSSDTIFGNGILIDGTGMGGTSATSRTLQHAQLKADEFHKKSVLTKDQLDIKKFADKVRQLAGRLGLEDTLTMRAIELVQAISKKDGLPNKLQNAYVLAIVFLVCKEAGTGRTDIDLARTAAADHTVGQTEGELRKAMIGHAHKLSALLQSELKGTKSWVGSQTSEQMPRFVSNLQLSAELCEPANHIASQARRFNIGTEGLSSKNQHAVAAISIFIVAWLLDVEKKPTFARVAEVVRVAEGVVHNTYSVMQPHVRRLLADFPFQCRLPGGIDSLPAPKGKKRPATPSLKM